MLMEERSVAKITIADLKRLGYLAADELKKFFLANPNLKRDLSNSLVAIALCQGAALHFIDGKTGIKDFDIYLFFGRYNRKLVNRKPKLVDSGLTKFGLYPADYKKGYKGRRIELLRRSIDDNIVRHEKGVPRACIIAYLRRHRTKTARELTKKAVVGIWPKTILGKRIWPIHY